MESFYTTEDGLYGGSFPVGLIKTSDGEILLGGITNGMNTFYPEKLKDNEFKPPVYLTSLEQGGKPLKTDSALEKIDEIILDADDNFFEFKYAALNYTNSKKNRYKYKLVGLDKNYYDAGTKRNARYAGLEPGMYILKVMGSNNDGLWSDKPIKINVNVKPDLEKIPLLITLEELMNGQDILFGHNNDQFSFEVAPLDYTIAEDNRYSYMLEGYDKNWINSKNKRYAHYNLVPAGNYRLKVREGDKTVIDTPIIITPTFYNTLWFRITAIIILIIIFLIIYILRTRALRQKQIHLEKMVEERTNELEKASTEISRRSKELQEANSQISERSKELEVTNNELTVVLINTIILGYSREIFSN